MSLYLVTGGCGFIGSHLADALVAAGHRVRILDDLSTGKRVNAPAAAEILVADVADLEAVRAAADGVDGIFHLAAVASVQRSNEDWLGTHRANQTGSICVFEAARRAKGGAPAPVVYASSAAVYGDNPHVPLVEDAETRPLTAYGADKLGSELHARVARLAHGVPTTGFRFFNIYGPRQDPHSPYSGVISIFAERALAGATVTIHGDGEQARDFVHVSDVVRFLRAAMDRPPERPDVFNVCTGIETSVKALARLITEAAGGRSAIAHGPPRPGDIRVSVGSPDKVRAAFGIAPETPLADGLAATIESIDRERSA